MLEKRLHFADIGLHRIGKPGELVGQDVGVGQTDGSRADQLRERPAVEETGIGELRKVIEIVVDGVIDPVFVKPAKGQKTIAR